MSDQDYENTIGRLDDQITELEEELNRAKEERDDWQGRYMAFYEGAELQALREDIEDMRGIVKSHWDYLPGDFKLIWKMGLRKELEVNKDDN